MEGPITARVPEIPFLTARAVISAYGLGCGRHHGTAQRHEGGSITARVPHDEHYHPVGFADFLDAHLDPEALETFASSSANNALLCNVYSSEL